MKKLIPVVLVMLAVVPAWAKGPEFAVGADHPLFSTAMPSDDARLTGRFEQEKTLEDLDATIESSGVFTFSITDGLRWSVQQPVASELRITREEIVEIQDGEEVMRMATDEQPMTRVISEIFFAMFTGDRGALENYFELSTSGSTEQWSLRLEPVDDAVASVMRSVELQGSDSVQQMILRETNGDKTRIRLNDVKHIQP